MEEIKTFVVKLKIEWLTVPEKNEVIGIVVDATDPNAAYKSVHNKMIVVDKISKSMNNEVPRKTLVGIDRINPVDFDCTILVSTVNHDNLEVLLKGSNES